MKQRFKPHLSLASRLHMLFAVLIIIFTLLLSVFFNAMMRRQVIEHCCASMQSNAHSVAQNVNELIFAANSGGLLDTVLFANRDYLGTYLSFVEHLTHSSVYIVDTHHNVTGYFGGLVQTVENPQLPSYIEQSIALGFLGKTPFIQSGQQRNTQMVAAMPLMNVDSEVLGVVLLTSTLRRQGFEQLSGISILIYSLAITLPFIILLSAFFSRRFTRPITALQKVARSLAEGAYDTRTQIRQTDEIGSLADSMDILAARLEEARERDNRLHAQQQIFFSNISHELKTPVTVIRGSLEALTDGVVRGEENIRAYYKQMITESRWLQRLILDLLELSRLQSPDYSLNLSTINLSELLGDVAMSAHALCQQKGCDFICQEPKTDFTFEGDYTRLRQMLLAVIDNAVKFTPEGKSISMHISGEQPEIIIADQGVGIPQDEIAHIFDRFRHTRDASRESTGLGLAIVQEIARRHQISIRITSREGEGTAFAFTFPRH